MGVEILTNRFGLPDTIVKACEYDTHRNAGTISVTTLIDAVQVRKLKEKHDYEVDVTEKIYALLGTSLHHILERSDVDHMKKQAFIMTAETLMKEAMKIESNTSTSMTPEEKMAQAQNLKGVANYLFQCIPVLFPEVGNRYIFELTLKLDYGDHVISGTFDLYDKLMGILYDYKFCSVYQYMHPESRDKWNQQTNIYAYMLIQAGYPVNGIRIVCFFRDWNKYGSMKERQKYPDRQIMEIPVEVRAIEKIEGLIAMRLDLHRRADAGENIECSGKDRWATATEYAVMVPKGKRALSIETSAAMAQKYIDDNRHKKANMYIETRPGESRRCAEYCPVSKFCPQYAKELEANK
jgi:hypothetical protein